MASHIGCDLEPAPWQARVTDAAEQGLTPLPSPLRSADLNSRIYSPGQMGVYGSLCYLVTGFLLLVEVEKSCSAVDQLRTVLRGPRASVVSHSPLSACFGCV